MLRAAEDVPQVGREPRQSDESRCVSHQLGIKAFLAHLCDILDDARSWRRRHASTGVSTGSVAAITAAPCSSPSADSDSGGGCVSSRSAVLSALSMRASAGPAGPGSGSRHTGPSVGDPWGASGDVWALAARHRRRESHQQVRARPLERAVERPHPVQARRVELAPASGHRARRPSSRRRQGRGRLRRDPRVPPRASRRRGRRRAGRTGRRRRRRSSRRELVRTARRHPAARNRTCRRGRSDGLRAGARTCPDRQGRLCARTSVTSGKRLARSASGSIRGIPRPAWTRIGTPASWATAKIASAAASPNPKACARGCNLMPRAPRARQRRASPTGSSAGSSRQ